MNWDAQTGFGRVVFGIAVATEPWWITSPARGRLSECRTYLLLGININCYDQMCVLNLHLIVVKFSVAWRCGK